MTNFEHTTREHGESIAQIESNCIAIDVSSYGDFPYHGLSPFRYSTDFVIPVPGMKGTFSHSVEGIWQGLKVIDDNIDPVRFRKRAKKRKGDVQGHKFGENLINLIEARWRIYVPAYTFFLDNYAPKEALDSLLSLQRAGREVFLYDVCDNGDIRNPAPLAHASVLATYLNFTVFNSKHSPLNEVEAELFTVLDAKQVPLENRLSVVRKLLLNPQTKSAFTYRCVEHPQSYDDYQIGLVLQGE